MTGESARFAVGLDSGTQGTKALVIDFDRADVLGRGYAPHALRPGLKPGESEQDPETWVTALNAALGAALAESKVDPRRVVALGISGQQHGFVPLDDQGRPIRPAKLWNDTSSAAETEWIVQKMGGKWTFIDKLGLSLAPGYTASKILWLKRHEPANYARLARILLPHDFLNYRLTGSLKMEYGDASGTGLMDIRKREWNPEVLAVIEGSLGEKLPPLQHSAEPLGYLREEFGRPFGLSKVLVSSGGGDNMMAAIGTGNVVPGICTLSLGTSGTIFAYSREPFIDPEGEVAAFCDSTGGWLPLICTMNVTNVTERFRALHGLSHEELERSADRVPAGSDGLLFLPFLDGERVPVLPQASGVYFGLNRTTFTAGHMARALMEGTILNLGYGLSRMMSLGLIPRQLRATGGGARSRLWLQIVADIFHLPVETLVEPESAALGAALQAVWCYKREHGQDISITAVAKDGVHPADRAVEPEAGHFDIYETLQGRFNSLWRSLEKEFREHRKVQGENPS